MDQASLVKVGDVIVIRVPYDPMLVMEIKRIPGRKYSGAPLKAWSVPAQYEEYARMTVRKYFPIEDEPDIALEGAPEPLEGPFAVLKSSIYRPPGRASCRTSYALLCRRKRSDLRSESRVV